MLVSCNVFVLWVVWQHAAGFDGQSHKKDHRVTLSQVLDSESATLPPYTEANNIMEGVPCFLRSSYSGIDHLKNVHGVARSQVSGTYIGRQAELDMNEQTRTWCKKKVALMLLSTRKASRRNSQVPPTRVQFKPMTVAHGGASAGCKPMKISCLLRLANWKGAVRTHQRRPEPKYQRQLLCSQPLRPRKKLRQVSNSRSCVILLQLSHRYR